MLRPPRGHAQTRCISRASTSTSTPPPLPRSGFVLRPDAASRASAHHGHRLHDRRCLKAVIHPGDLNREQIVNSELEDEAATDRAEMMRRATDCLEDRLRMLKAGLVAAHEGSGANRLRDRAGRCVRPTPSAISCCQHGIPDGRRTSTLEMQPAEIERSLVDSVQQFNAGYRDRSGLKPLKPQHWTDA